MIYDFTITTGKGESLNLSDYKGTVNHGSKHSYRMWLYTAI